MKDLNLQNLEQINAGGVGGAIAGAVIGAAVGAVGYIFKGGFHNERFKLTKFRTN
ncbi:hypothetical protein [Clostridium botulinum]|uniref:hypothetical protein n=1 Tax=Clostridium botulinum TaxID=1491 RepID=UPI0018A33434|nr:hypothetical protein [Clostridium botulinum]